MRWLVVALLLLATPRAHAQDRPRDCAGLPPEPAWLAAAPVYRDCDVDKPAKRKGREPELSPAYFGALGDTFECQAIHVEFVVNPEGLAEIATLRIVQSDFPGLTTAVREVLPELRFNPAQLTRQRVRQLVVYARGVNRGVAYKPPFRVKLVDRLSMPMSPEPLPPEPLKECRK